MKLPAFLIIGAAKCGTTSLYHQLSQHPQVYLPNIKEPTFFSKNGVGTWNRGLNWYSSLFAEMNDQQIGGEASTSYSKAPWYGDSAENIKRIIPKVKLLYMVRDPVKQIISHYDHMLFSELVSGSLSDNLKKSDYLIKVANYAFQMDKFTKIFPKNQIHVITLEQYTNQNFLIFSQVCNFLGIEPIKTNAVRQNSRNQRMILKHKLLKHLSNASNMSPNDRQTLLPKWMLKKQSKSSVKKSDINHIHYHLKHDLLRFAEAWGLDISAWGIHQ